MQKHQLDTAPLTNWNGPHGLPEFDQIADSDFAAAFDVAMAAHNAQISAIAGNAAEATLANTLEALELAGDPLSRVSSIFWLKAGAHTNPADSRDWSARYRRKSRGISRRSA